MGIFFLVFGILSVTAIDVEINNEVIVTCPLTGVEFPAWTGPSSLAKPLTNGIEIQEPGILWVENKNLKIESAQTKHTGEYKCIDGAREALAQVNVLTYNVTVQFLNVETESVTGEEKVVGEINKVMTVVCQVNGGNPAPSVTLAFDDDVTNPPDVREPVVTQMMTEENTYSVNVSVTFNANASASYPDKNATKEKVLIYLQHPPLLNFLSTTRFPSLELNQMDLKCDTESRPETTFKWMIGGKKLTATDLDVVENYQGCTQDSTTYMFTCLSNITISNIGKEDNGKPIICELVYLDTTTRVHEVQISMPFKATMVAISGNAFGVIDADGKVTLTLTCASDPAKPAADLSWYIGTDRVEINSTYPVVETNAMYDGKNVSQNIDIVADRTMNGEEVACCADVDICDTVVLNIQYPQKLLAPMLNEYRAYSGDNITIPCIADSRPVAFMAWYSMEGQSSTLISNNAENPSNAHHLQIVNISTSDGTQYECKAWSQLQDVSKAVSKIVTLLVFDKPAEPVVETTADAEKYYIEIKTSASAPEIPRKFYIQYRKVGATSWQEISTGYDDTLPGQQPTNYSYGFMKSDLDPDSEYEFRVKSVDGYGLVSYSAQSSIKTEKVITKEEDTVSMTKYRSAIIISVFATAALFLIILIVIGCAIKNGKSQAVNPRKRMTIYKLEIIQKFIFTRLPQTKK